MNKFFDDGFKWKSAFIITQYFEKQSRNNFRN